MKILKFRSDWCNPCRVMATLLDGFNKCEMTDINIDLDPDTTSKYNVRSIPTLVIVDDNGEELWRKSGVTNKLELEKVVASLK